VRTTPLVCPSCGGGLLFEDSALVCAPCATRYPVAEGIADFSGGQYYDVFSPGDRLTEEHERGLAGEVDGARTRAAYYARLIRRRTNRSARVLDIGCGNGLAVDLLSAAGHEAWGNDLSALRKWQWRTAATKERLVVSDATRLPFPDGFFDVVIASGVLEHIGVDELGGRMYVVTRRVTRDAERARFIAEALRVCSPAGSLFLDFPNGRFPIDFWHGVAAGGARWHSRSEGFLPSLNDVRALLDEHAVRVRALNPRGRLRFQQVGRHWYGRLFAPLARAFYLVLGVPGLRWLARTALNPYLVLEITRR
jgi:SAM-dependent methyltransferase